MSVTAGVAELSGYLQVVHFRLKQYFMFFSSDMSSANASQLDCGDGIVILNSRLG